MGLLPTLLMLRIYEYIAAGARHVLPADAATASLYGVRSDIALTFWTAAILIAPVLAVAHKFPRSAVLVHRLLLVFLSLVGLALTQYFTTTFVPLGADLFGYSWRDIHNVTLSAKGLGLVALLPLTVPALITWYVTRLLAARPLPDWIVVAFYAAMLASAILVRPLSLNAANFASDAEYYLAQNKTAYFASRAAGYARHGVDSDDNKGKLTGYPLLHAVKTDDVLGPFLRIGDKPPNIVFVMVEGLGRDFVGDGAYYGGFTPFLDSLAQRSLYWENFMSTSGRTFGMLPSLVGSLPYAEDGFMGLGSRMPKHVTLVNLLKARGYTPSYFTGTDAHFDNVDVFMERQGADRIVDQSKFGPEYTKQPADEGGFSWGYPDLDLFRLVLKQIASEDIPARLDIYKTTTSHEPFIPPNTALYDARFEARLAAIAPPPERAAEFRKYKRVFATLLYVDDAMRYFFQEYSKRSDFNNTLIFVSGDHRIIPVPARSRIGRYHVPLWIVSPLVREPRHFSSVSSHLDIAPTILSFLEKNYGMEFPRQMSWLGTGIDTAQRFRSIHSLPLMHVKNEFEYLDGVHYFAGDQLFRLDSTFGLTRVSDSRLRDSVRAKLREFQRINRFVTSGDHLYPSSPEDRAQVRETIREDSLYRALGLEGKSSDAAFAVARDDAFAKNYDRAQMILRRVLRDAPNHHDARLLLGRMAAWQGRHEEARKVLAEVVRRAPRYLDARLAAIDAAIWAGRRADAVRLADEALTEFPGNFELSERRQRAAGSGR